jgi:hypothetical protein
MRPEQYAKTRNLNIYTLRYWLRCRLLPHMKVGRMILIDPFKADKALEKFEVEEVSK